MKELSIFIDESGDFGEYNFHSPYYIIAMVMHDQAYDLSAELSKLENELHAGKLAKQLSWFLRDNMSYFASYDVVKVYYDNGQIELNKILSSVFNVLFDNVEFRKVIPSDYRLFQVADLVCTLQLLELKCQNHTLSNSEKRFFENDRTLKKNYLKPLKQKMME